jgi:peptide subunit release factor 1 (eRF1)
MNAHRDLEPLLKYVPRPSSPVLSLYLDTGSARGSTNPRHILTTSARGLLAAVREEAQAQGDAAGLDEDIRGAESFLAGFAPDGRSLVLFCDASEGLLWHRTYPIPLAPEARWRPEPFLRPLLETLDDQERFGVVLLDRQQARLLTVHLGQIEEHREAFAPLEVRTIRTTGTDHLFSEKRFQRRADEHAHLHTKRVAALLRSLQREQQLDRLVIAGPIEATSDLQRLLPRPLADRVAAVWKLPIDTREAELLRLVGDLQEALETERLDRLVGELLDAARHGHLAVLGLEETLAAVREGRVTRMLYAADDPREGGRCRGCRSLTRSAAGECPFCRGPLDPVRDLVTRMARAVYEAGGRLDRLEGPAAERVRGAGGIGAFLRY